MNAHTAPLLALFCTLATAGCVAPSVTQTQGKNMYWTQDFERLLPLLGHRNWILVVDKAYPYQSAPGITYLDTKAPLPDVLARVVTAVKASSHVKPVYYTDQELAFLSEDLVAGVDAFRAALQNHLAGAETKTLLHDSVFKRLDEAAKLFNVVVLKTECTIPYSSVFIELDCAYWSAEKEKALRSKMR
jgi:hypothetical protein